MPSLDVNFFITLTVILLLSLTGESTPIHRSHLCSNTTFSPNSPYQSNINSLLSSLYSNSKLGKHFDQITAGHESPSTTVYGSYLCRGDLDANACQDCVATATDEATDRCPLQKEAIFYGTTSVWYDTRIDHSSKSWRRSPVVLWWIHGMGRGKRALERL